MTTAAGLAISVVQTLFNALECQELRELGATYGYKTRLEELKKTVETIRGVLLGVEANDQQLTPEGKRYIDRLKDAVYDADDLFDKFIISQREKQLASGKIFKKVRRFLSNDNPLLFALSMSKEIKAITKKLDAIASDRNNFGLNIVFQPREKRASDHNKFGLNIVFQPREKRETISYVCKDSIIGRANDKEAIVDMLLPPSADDLADVSFVTIVGMGGLGKTALAQFVYNDDMVESAFHLKLWVCVSEEFDLKEILGKMLLSATMKGHDGLGMDELQRKVREQIQGKRYLLVLDDVWDENRNDWVQLREFLIVGGLGSRILVTTRSLKVAAAIGDDPMYELPGLTDETSWLLFKNMAYKKGQEEAEPDLVEIGKDIVEKCANNPLALRVVGSMLYGQEKNTWDSIRRNDLAKVERDAVDGNGIIPTLKLSYYNLPYSQLKSCFSFCALFPKDYVMEKRMLINLWLAHNCLVPTLKDQSIEDVGENYFSILLQRCFFQDIKVDKYGDITSCKMHDFMHDLAREVAGNENSTLPPTPVSLENIRHVSMTSLDASDYDYVVKMKKLRTFLWLDYRSFLYTFDLAKKLSNQCSHLRVLEIMNCNSMEELPGAVCALLHLRYLNLSYCGALKMLPNSITKLYNLQVLILLGCSKLRELPRELSELVSLRHLDLAFCDSLTHMPAGMDKLTHLHTLTKFVVGQANGKDARVGQLTDLKALANLSGDIRIDVRSYLAKDASGVSKETNVSSKANLKTLEITFEESSVEGDIQEALLEGLQPNKCSLKEMVIRNYYSLKLPSWRCLESSSRSNTLPCLVRIVLSYLPRLQHLPALSQLPHLKYLELDDIPNLEYMEEKNGDAAAGNSNSNSNSESAARVRSSITQQVTFFPSLEELILKRLWKLKGWWREELSISSVGLHREQDDQDQDVDLPFFPCLRTLHIYDFESMTSFPGIPKVEDLKLMRGKEDIGVVRFGWKRMRSSYSYSWSCLESEPLPLERRLETNHIEYLSCLPEEFVRGLVHLKMWFGDYESLPEGLRRYASSLGSLDISHAYKLKTLKGLEHLTSLQELKIGDCANLMLEDEDELTPWNSLHSLSSLELDGLPKLVNLPQGLKYLTALHSLRIWACDNLEGLPEWLDSLSSLQSLTIDKCPKLKSLPEAMRRLTSLNLLKIVGCDGLTERCQSPSGEDYPKISHIPKLNIPKS